ncbi:hypothetical protein Acr_27g0002070 [Actinidia rufa]|uniref:Uncharacterized protein n=1 Tax=Actinidia rufa TaxID=165716 RepID=A0A7J0H612_9ERIC|nr:hypothetical protein Acr_27g0002070 [Actinidia rufa]
MDIEGGNLNIVPFQTEGIQFEDVHEPQNVQEQEGNEEYETDHVDQRIHKGVNADTEHPSFGKYSTQEGTSTQEGPPAWFIEYFRDLKDSLGRIEQRQEEIIQTQAKHGEYIDRLGDFYQNMNVQQQASHQQYSNLNC